MRGSVLSNANRRNSKKHTSMRRQRGEVNFFSDTNGAALPEIAQPTVSFEVSAEQLSVIDDRGRRMVEPGEFSISAGGKQPGFKGHLDAPRTDVVSGNFAVTGKPTGLHLK